jgi:hypothetical protein
VLDERKMKVALMKAQGIEITQISKDVGISRQTVYTWLDSDDVKAEVLKHGQEFLSQTIQMIGVEGPRNIKALVYLRDHADSEKVRLDAACKLLDKTVSNATHIEIDDNRDINPVSIDVLEQEINSIDNE